MSKCVLENQMPCSIVLIVSGTTTLKNPPGFGEKFDHGYVQSIPAYNLTLFLMSIVTFFPCNSPRRYYDAFTVNKFRFVSRKSKFE